MPLLHIISTLLEGIFECQIREEGTRICTDVRRNKTLTLTNEISLYTIDPREFVRESKINPGKTLAKQGNLGLAVCCPLHRPRYLFIGIMYGKIFPQTLEGG